MPRTPAQRECRTIGSGRSSLDGVAGYHACAYGIRLLAARRLVKASPGDETIAIRPAEGCTPLGVEGAHPQGGTEHALTNSVSPQVRMRRYIGEMGREGYLLVAGMQLFFYIEHGPCDLCSMYFIAPYDARHA